LRRVDASAEGIAAGRQWLLTAVGRDGTRCDGVASAWLAEVSAPPAPLHLKLALVYLANDALQAAKRHAPGAASECHPQCMIAAVGGEGGGEAAIDKRLRAPLPVRGSLAWTQLPTLLPPHWSQLPYMPRLIVGWGMPWRRWALPPVPVGLTVPRWPAKCAACCLFGKTAVCSQDTASQRCRRR